VVQDATPFRPATATKMQVALGVWDMCPYWCGIVGTGQCHSTSPYFDNVRVFGVQGTGLSFIVRRFERFQDTFVGGHGNARAYPDTIDHETKPDRGRADAGWDVAPSSDPRNFPGDSVSITIASPQCWTGVTGAYLWMRATRAGQEWHTAGEMESQALRNGNKRFPYLGDQVDADGRTWHKYAFDSCFTRTGHYVPDRWCVDLADSVFLPGDTILYFFEAQDGCGNVLFYPAGGADFNAAARDPMEFTILPANAYEFHERNPVTGDSIDHPAVTDILYVDDMDGRGEQQFYDYDFSVLLIRPDRYDVLGPSSDVGNGLGGRSEAGDLILNYRKVIWSSGNLESNTISDGVSYDKGDDAGVLW